MTRVVQIALGSSLRPARRRAGRRRRIRARRSRRSSSRRRSTPRARSGSTPRSSDAADEGAPLVIIRLDTPGGLESSMREIVKDIIDAPMPVVVYVSPDGARAASAGAFIAEAADVVAMAPQTNIGSASAIQSNGEDIGGTLGVKIQNDAAAFIRALAESHGRDGDLPSQMVTDAANFTARRRSTAARSTWSPRARTTCCRQLDGFTVAGPEADDAADRRPRRSTTATCRSSTSCWRSSSTRPSPICSCSSASSGSRSSSSAPGLIIPGARRRGLAAARRLRLGAAAGDRGWDRSARRRPGADHRRGAVADPRRPRRRPG